FLGKGVAVGPTFGVKPRAGITVPVPGTAYTGAGLEHPSPQAEFAQAVELVEARNPGADDDRVEIGSHLRDVIVGNLELAHRLSSDYLRLTVAHGTCDGQMTGSRSCDRALVLGGRGFRE